jgi:hypothetical protein
MASAPLYVTVEEIKQATEMRAGSRSDSQIKRVLDTASRLVEQRMHRDFYPTLETRTFDWPNEQYARGWRLWLDRNELASDSGVTMTVAGTSISTADFFLRPDNGPPFTHVEIDRASSSTFASGATPQRSIAITGLYGYSAETAPAGLLNEGLDASETAVEVTDSASIGIGSIIQIDSERMLVTGKSQIDSGQNLATPLTASTANTTVAVADGTAFTAGEVILLDSERMLILDIAGNNLIVKRQWDGTVLATHATPDIYVPRILTVERGALGTTAASHLTATAIRRHEVPGAIHGITMALTLYAFHQQEIGYSSTTGGQLGQSSRESKGKALEDLWDRTSSAIGRQARIRAA